MTRINAWQRITAAAVATGVTFSLVWSMATLGYPASSPAAPSVAVAERPITVSVAK